MATPPRTTFAAHYLRYASANVLVLAAGLVSFPITTRLLTNAQFGILSYWETALLFAVAVLKLGAGEALMRFYPHGANAPGLSRYVTNLVMIPAAITLVAWLVLMGGMVTVAAAGGLDTPQIALLAMAQALPAAWGAMLLRVLQAREQSTQYSMVQVTWRWAVVAATLLMLIYVAPSASSALIGRLVAHGVVVGVVGAWLVRQLRFSRHDIDMPYAMEGLRFGMPVAMMEICLVSMWSIDRVMLKWLLDDFDLLGIYSIGMALASYIDQTLSTALSQAVGPVINRIYGTEGAVGVRRMKIALLRPLVYLSAALGAGLVIAGPDLLAILASSSKSQSAPIFVLMGCVFLLRPILATSSEGLLLQKRSRIVSVLTVTVALVSIGLNFLMIPRFGVFGACYTSCICVLGLQLMLFTFCPRELRVAPPWRVVLGAGSLALLTVGVASETHLFGLAHPATRVVAATALVLVGCLLPPVIFDGRIRSLCASKVPALRWLARAS